MNLKNMLMSKAKFGGLQGSPKLKIICADDQYLNLEALNLVFRKLGLQDNCELFSDGKTVVKWFIQHMQDRKAHSRDSVVVVIIDFEMGGMNGLEAVKEVKALYNVVNENYRRHDISRKGSL